VRPVKPGLTFIFTLEMTLYEFRSLNKDQQAVAAWQGTFLDSRFDGVHDILLYDLGGFYVEVLYSPEQNKIKEFRPFKSTTPLNPYLDRMQSDDLGKIG
jgi:hypothetical protein